MNLAKSLLNKVHIVFFRYRRRFLEIFAFLVLFFGLWFTGAYISMSPWFERGLAESQMASKFYPAIKFAQNSTNIIYLPHRLLPGRLLKYSLKISQEDLQNLSNSGNIVSAKLNYENNSYDVELKRYDAQSQIWEENKKNWLIFTKSDELSGGQKEINLLMPFDKNYFIDTLADYRLEKIGIKKPQNSYVSLELNGKPLGIFYKVENPTLSSEEKSAAENKLAQLINNTDDEKLIQQIDELFDLKSFNAWYLNDVLNDFQTGGGAVLNFDSENSKFQLNYKATGQVDELAKQLVNRLLGIPSFVQDAEKIAWEYISGENNLRDELNYYDETYRLIRRDIYRDQSKAISNLNYDILAKNGQAWLAKSYENAHATLSQAKIYAILRKTQDENFADLEIDLESLPSINFQRMDIITDELRPQAVFSLYDKNGQKLSDLVYDGTKGEYRSGSLSQILTPKRLLGQFDQTAYNFSIKANNEAKGLKIKDIDLEIDNFVSNEKVDIVFSYIDKTPFAQFEEVSSSIQEFLNRYPIFRKISENKIAIGPGNFNITRNIIVPKNLILEIAPGTNFYFDSKISLVSYSQVICQGTKENPITFRPIDKNKPWGNFGIVGQGADGSIIEYSEFEYGSDSFINGIYFSGQLAVHEAKVEVRNSKFSYAQADDGLNIKYGRDSIVKDNYFYRNSFDAIDYDWTDGRIEGNYFEGNGNDGVDLSGHSALIINNFVNGSGDKCISLGEKTYAKVVNNLLKGCIIGIAVKDLSEPEIINNTIIDNEFGISVYQKREIFGGGKPKVFNTILWDNDKQVELDAFSKIDILYSDIQNGYDGENNLDIKPNFTNENKLDFTLTGVGNKYLLESGNAEVLKEILSVDKINIGIFNDFKTWNKI